MTNSNFYHALRFLYFCNENFNTKPIISKLASPEEMDHLENEYKKINKDIEEAKRSTDNIINDICSKCKDVMDKLVDRAFELVRETLYKLTDDDEKKKIDKRYSNGNFNELYCLEIENSIKEINNKDEENNEAIQTIFENVHLFNAARDVSRIRQLSHTDNFDEPAYELYKKQSAFLQAIGALDDDSTNKSLPNDDISERFIDGNKAFANYLAKAGTQENEPPKVENNEEGDNAQPKVENNEEGDNAQPKVENNEEGDNAQPETENSDEGGETRGKRGKRGKKGKRGKRGKRGS